MTANTRCPDFSSHEQNAADQWAEVHGRPASLPEEQAEVDALAEAEYQACEGHQ